MDIATRKFNWVKRPTAWQQAEAWRLQRRNFTQKSMSDADTFNVMFARSAADRVEGLVKLATEAAVKRINAAAKAKIDETVAGLDQVKLDMKI
jgi:hypothetical protein